MPIARMAPWFRRLLLLAPFFVLTFSGAFVLSGCGGGEETKTGAQVKDDTVDRAARNKAMEDSMKNQSKK